MIRLKLTFYKDSLAPFKYGGKLNKMKLDFQYLPLTVIIYLSLPVYQHPGSFDGKKLTVLRDQQEYPKCEIDNLVPITPHSRIFHRLN